ncbi:BREX-1 system phosphatase PglZ type B [Pigmentiphaga aceris]|uniref:BREX-1 system phosphatase PglZ type B n=1 Tax=Pigmentiphaga aceris TaxID=1940612 RepID=A0A5C0ARZ1_9BURK|nr:BREX-1 system phosphatase PglZ type B [Pigmentiphaga aceris]QEI04952.1 BREX-1 system phosphatase PglZ type B [Pigmentiphaga aceris]
MSRAPQRSPSTDSVGTALATIVRSAAKGNSHAAVPAAAILWPDKDGHWLAAMPALSKLMPNLCMLGAYAPEQRSGPAIWLKCAIAGLLPEVKLDGVPVVYLPGVSRAELRAVESCPHYLQPLAELQYRGVFWSQSNAKDWTPGAFLASKNGGLGLDVTQDKATQEALGQALQAGVLLAHGVAELEGRAINAEWLLGLMAPNPTRDLLLWMNEPEATRREWGDVLWNIFAKRCKADFGFDPIADGVLVAAERLAKAEGKWSAVSQLYRDSFSSFPNVFGLLAKVQPPQLGLFPDQSRLAGYPQVNEQSEAALRYALFACASMDAPQARATVLAAEEEHGVRRGWLWARMGRSPLVAALAHLAKVAERSALAPIGQSPAELASSYRHNGWEVDDAALNAMGSVHAKADSDAVKATLRAVYLPWLEEAALRLQEAAMAVGGLPPLAKQADEPVAGSCTVFVDGLRYDVAARLSQRLAALGKVDLSAHWTSLPSVTASGKPWCSPVSSYVVGAADAVDFEPISGHNFRKLLAEHGVQPLGKHEKGDPLGKAWTEAGDLDHYGHEHGVRLARDLDTQLNQVVERVEELIEAGWNSVRIVTDHGWLLMPGGLPKSELPKHQAETRWGRCAVLKDSAHGTPLTFGWDWCKDVQVAYAPGVACFSAGTEYAHGGISLQECLVPMLQLQVAGASGEAASVTIRSVVWKGLRCSVVVEGAAPGRRVDIRTKAALASSSLVSSTKALEGGKASLAVADDDHMGAAAVVVVLSADGEVLQKRATAVGEN